MSYTDGEMAYLLPGTLREEILRWQREIEERNAASRAAWDVFRGMLTETWEASNPDTYRGESPLDTLVRQRGREGELTLEGYFTWSDTPSVEAGALESVRAAFVDGVREHGFVPGTREEA